MDGQRVHFCSLSSMAVRFVGVVTKLKLPRMDNLSVLCVRAFLATARLHGLIKFLRALDAAIINHTTMHPSVPLPSSLLLAIGADGKPLLPLQLMSYASALKHLRHMISLPWKKSRPYFDELSRLKLYSTQLEDYHAQLVWSTSWSGLGGKTPAGSPPHVFSSALFQRGYYPRLAGSAEAQGGSASGHSLHDSTSSWGATSDARSPSAA